MPADRICLVRHGEVHNPDHVVYADLPGFGLSELGRRQAAATGRHLAASPVGRLVTSPLERARETADLIAAATGAQVTVDERLTEWHLSARWAGLAWDDLPVARPGEVEAYLAHPEDLEFSPEPLADLAERMRDALIELAAATPRGDLVAVSHQDPVHAARRILTGEGFGAFNAGKPGHAAVVTLARTSSRWTVAAEWEPEQGHSFPPRSS